MHPLNSLLNHIHEWGENEQHPMKRMFLTRFACFACSGIELFALGLSLANLGAEIGKAAISLSTRSLQIIQAKGHPPKKELLLDSIYSQRITKKFLLTCKLVAGLASTLLVGVILSPEVNFRIHLKLELAVDNLIIKKQKELKARGIAETKAIEISKARALRIAKFDAERLAHKKAQEKAQALDERLAELLLPKIFAA